MNPNDSVPYRAYWIAWIILLAVTLAMVTVESRAVLLGGMALKASIIAAWYMHLKYEKPFFVACIALGILATGFLLFGLIAPDGIDIGSAR